MSTDQAIKTLHEAAKIALTEHRYEEVIKHLSRALAINPQDLPAYSMTGIAHQRLGQTETALHYFRQAVYHGPHDPCAHFNLGQMLHITGEDVAAIECLHECLKIDPEHTTARELLSKLEPAV